MGRAQRANPRSAMKSTLTDGPRNPDTNRLTARGYDVHHHAFGDIRRRGKVPTVVLAGTRYAVDAHGTFRRVPPDTAAHAAKE